MQEILSLQGVVKDYDWGMGSESLVATLGGVATKSEKYAELWVGTHPNGIATVANEGTLLSQVLKNAPQEYLGEVVAKEFGSSLPFLFKILSVGSALSIQAHPTADAARKLYEREQERLQQDSSYIVRYPDPYPKPEVGIALSDVELLYGFRRQEELVAFLESSNEQYVPEFAELLGSQLVAEVQQVTKDYSEFLRKVYATVFAASSETITRLSQGLLSRLKEKQIHRPEERWLLELESKYPYGDVGFFSFFILNLVTVPKYKALFIGPNIAHAYLKNQLAECMAPSDNVVRAGLTSKVIDVDTLLAMLEYREQKPQLLDPIEKSSHYYEYALPDNGFFDVGLIRNEGASTVQLATAGSVELLFSIDGMGNICVQGGVTKNIAPGSALLIPANVPEYRLELEKGSVFRIRSQSRK